MLDPQFASTSKILFGNDIGKLTGYENYLSELIEKPLITNSAVSGKQIVLSRNHYSKNARFVALDETTKLPAPKLDINAIKDIDSLQQAVCDNLYYCGNSNIGISTQVEESDACNDSAFVQCSHQVIKSKNVAHSYGVRECENVFGCMLVGEVKFSMRSQITFKSVRCFESYLCLSSSDLFFSFNCRSCSDAMFSFNQTSKRNLIGNLELPKEKYLNLKEKLIGEIAEELEKNKKYPSLFELIGGG